ncbi:MAG: magnesium transporter [Candidatus Bathyarchaeota archaeon]|nr:magnesium transporter [Candidatus Bathyarchaeota archaeon]
METGSIGQADLIKTTGQSLVSLVFGLGDILAGFVVFASLDLLSQATWMIPLLPGVLSMRGVIGGLFSGRLSTGLHLGTIKADSLDKNTKALRLLHSSVVVLTFESSIVLGFMSLAFGMVFWGMDLLSGLTMLSVLIATMALSLLAISPLTIAIAFSSFKRGLDPDIIVYPIVSTLADILATLCYVLVLNMTLYMGLVGQLLVGAICAIFTSWVLLVAARGRRDMEFLRTAKESLYMLIVVSTIVGFTGSALSQMSEITGQWLGILVIYPALLNVTGGFGAVIGASATTRLALGTMDSSFKSIKQHVNQIAGAWIASVVMYLTIALVSVINQVSVSLTQILTFVLLILATNLFAGLFMVAIALSVAILSFHGGLNPDNFVIPIESSLADAITTLSLLIMFSL